MKLLILKDMHLRYGFETPTGRTEQFFSQIDNKLAQVIAIAKQYDCKGLISTGDMLDKATNYQFKSVKGIQDKLKELKAHFELGILSIVGNHELLWASRDYKKETFYQHLINHGYIHDIAENPIKVGEYTLGGIDFTTDLNKLKAELKELDKKHKKLIVVLHAHLVPDESQRIPFGEYLTYDTIANGLENTEMIIAGHLHKGFPIKQVKGITFINQWSFTRLSRDYYAVSGQHIPQVVIIDTDKLHEPITIDLKVDDYDSTFIQKELSREAEIQKNLVDFVCKCNEVSIDSNSVVGSIPLALKEQVEYYLNKAEEAV